MAEMWHAPVPEVWHGTVVAVEGKVAQTELVGTHTAPLSVLTVLDVSGLPETGSVVIGDDTLVYTAKADTDDPDAAATNDTLTLAAATVNTYAAGAPVIVTPERPYKEALVLQDGAAEAVRCRVGHNWQDVLLEETERPIGGLESVEVTVRRGGPVVTDVLGVPLERHLGYTKPSSLPASSVNERDWVGDQVTARLVTATDMTAATITGATVQTARPEDTGRRTWMDQDGFHQTSSGGVPRIDFPTTTGGTNFMRGTINADSALFLGGVVARDDVTISPGGGTVTLGTALSDPKSPPVSLCDWEGVAIVRDAVPSYGLQRVSGAWYYAQAGGLGGNRVSLRTFADDGTADTQVLIHGGGPPTGGVVRVGSNWFVLHENASNASWDLNKYDLSGNLVATATIGVPSRQSDVLGTDGTYLYVGYVYQDGFVRIVTYDTSLASVGSTLTTALALPDMTPLAYIGKGNFDFGATRFVVAARGSGTGIPGIGAATGTAYVLNSSGVEQTAESFPIADSANSLAGMTWDGTNFWSMHDGSPKLYKYTDGCKADTGDNLTLWVSGDWYQVAGTYHTKVSPAAKVTYVKRSRLQSSMGGVPGSGGVDDPDTTQTFIGRGASDPGPAGSYLNATSATDSGDTIVESPVFSGTTAPTTNTFPTSGPAGKLRSDDGTKLIAGDHTGEIYDLIAAASGGGGSGGIDIDCGTFGGVGMEIDCGGFI